MSVGEAPAEPATPRRSAPVSLILAAAASASLLALFVLPLFALLRLTSIADLSSVAADPGLRASFAFTAYASSIALALSLVTGIPLGYLLARRAFPGRTIVESVVTLPVVLPHLVGGLALLLLFSPASPVGAWATRSGFEVFGTIWGVVLVMVYVSAPYVVLSSQLAFRAVDPQLGDVARSLGARPSWAFGTVTLPIALRGIAAGGILAWARSVSEIGGFLILAYTVYPGGPYQGPATSPVSVYIYNLYQIGDLRSAVAVSAWFVLGAFVLFLAVRLLERRGFLPWQPGALGR
jgi:ABC-type sulfate transport system permease component